MDVSGRLTRWVEREFPTGSSEHVLADLRQLPATVVGGQNPERVQAPLVIRTRGDWRRFQEQLALVHLDWRDALVAADLGNDDWPSRLTKSSGATNSRVHTLDQRHVRADGQAFRPT